MRSLYAGNPLCQQLTYRLAVAAALPQAQVLDGKPLAAERQPAQDSSAGMQYMAALQLNAFQAQLLPQHAHGQSSWQHTPQGGTLAAAQSEMHPRPLLTLQAAPVGALPQHLAAQAECERGPAVTYQQSTSGPRVQVQEAPLAAPSTPPNVSNRSPKEEPARRVTGDQAVQTDLGIGEVMQSTENCLSFLPYSCGLDMVLVIETCQDACFDCCSWTSGVPQ